MKRSSETLTSEETKRSKEGKEDRVIPFNDRLISDITIRCGDQVFFCSKAILAQVEYFYSAFRAGMKEAQNGTIEFSPEDISAIQLETFLRYLYGQPIVIPDLDRGIELFEKTHLFHYAPWITILTDRIYDLCKTGHDRIKCCNLSYKYGLTDDCFCVHEENLTLDLLYGLSLPVLKFLLPGMENPSLQWVSILTWIAFRYLESDASTNGLTERTQLAKEGSELVEKYLPDSKWYSRADVVAMVTYLRIPFLFEDLSKIIIQELKVRSRNDQSEFALPTLDDLQDYIDQQ